MMVEIEKVIKTLDDVLKKYQKFKKLSSSFDNESFSIIQLKKLTLHLNESVFSTNTKLLLLNQLLNDYFSQNKLLSLNNYYVHESRNLAFKYNLNKEIIGSWNNKLEAQEGEDRLSGEYYADMYSPLYNLYISYPVRIKKTDSKEKLKDIFFEMLEWYKNDIDMIAYHRYYIKEESLNDQFENVQEHAKQVYLFSQEWIDGTITLAKWKAFHSNNFLDDIEFYNDITVLDNVKKLQLKLYNEALDLELNALKRQFNELDTMTKRTVAELHDKLLSSFLNGTYSSIDLKRLNNVIDFDRHEDVLITYDNITRYEYINYFDLIPYDGEFGIKSPRLSADLIMKYREFISEFLNSKSDVLKNNKVVAKKTKAQYNSFGFKNKSQIKVLEKVLNELNSLVNFIDIDNTSINSAVNILIAADYTTEQGVIHKGCKTVEFCYILKSLSQYFSNLNGSSIQISKKFKTSKDRFLKQSNYNKSSNSITKLKEEIDNIIKQLK